jgi:hypothetical protein
LNPGTFVGPPWEIVELGGGPPVAASGELVDVVDVGWPSPVYAMGR